VATANLRPPLETGLYAVVAKLFLPFTS
jgi:hypothetical protein